MVAIMSSNAGHATSFSSNKSLPLFNNALKSFFQQEIRDIYVVFYVYVARIIAKRQMFFFSFLVSLLDNLAILP